MIIPPAILEVREPELVPMVCTWCGRTVQARETRFYTYVARGLLDKTVYRQALAHGCAAAEPRRAEG